MNEFRNAENQVWSQVRDGLWDAGMEEVGSHGWSVVAPALRGVEQWSDNQVWWHIWVIREMRIKFVA